MKLNILFPPSTNGLHVNSGRNRPKTERYKTWIRAVDNEIMLQPKEYFKGPVALAFVFEKPDKRKRDLDNLLKAPIDTLVRHGILEDDDQVTALKAEWGEENSVEVTAHEND